MAFIFSSNILHGLLSYSDYGVSKETWQKSKAVIILKVNESRCKQCEVTPYFSSGQNVLKKYWEKINIDNWEKLFLPGKVYWKKLCKKQIFTQSIKKSFLIDPLI